MPRSSSPQRGRSAMPSTQRGRPGQGVQVIVRVRPMLPRELRHDNAVEVLSEQELVVFKPDAEFASTYDTVLGVHSTQQDLYQLVRGGILSALEGYNSTVFAYGQTGTGKTHSMMGPPGVDLACTMAGPAGKGSGVRNGWEGLGIIPRALSDLFEQVQLRSSRDGVRVTVAASYLEIYNDRLYDLLQPYKKGMGGRDPADMMQNKALHEVREDKTGATCVPNALCVKVTSLSSVLTLLTKGARHRAVRHTEMNMQSSRSHAVLQLVVEQYPQGPASSRGTVLRSKLNFVDLAGNERWNKEVDMGAARVGEMTAINGSLSALATVVAALTEGASRKHVPYRDSKLTHLLQDSLGGNCRTAIVATVSPSVMAFDETVSTLKFADRASAIGNNPVVNTSRDMGSVLALKEREIMRLRQLLAEYMDSGQSGTAAEPGAASSGGAPAEQEGQQPAEGTNASISGAEQLRLELETTRRALDMERQLRTELEAQLRLNTGPNGVQQIGTPVGHGGQSASGMQPPSEGESGRSLPAMGPGVDYIRVPTPLETSSDCLSPDTAAANSPSTHTVPSGNSSTWQPFKAVMSRRAELGLASSAGTLQPHSRGTSPLHQGSSPMRHGTHHTPQRSNSALNLHPQRAWAPNGPQSTSPRAPSTLQHHGSLMEAAVRNIREQVMQLTLLEQQNKQRMAASLAANRAAHRANASPLRQRHATSAVYNPPARSRAAHSTQSAGGSAPLGHGPPPPAHDSFGQLLAAAHSTVQNSQQAVPALSGSSDPPAAPAPQLPSTGGSGSWGRSAILRASSNNQDWTGLPVNSSQDRQPTASSAWSAPASGVSGNGAAAGPATAGWGRTALLAGVAGSPPQVPLSAPAASGAWGRSMVQQQQQYQEPSQPPQQQHPYQQHPYQQASETRTPVRHGSAQRHAGRLDKGSLIYILGASTSSIRAKSMASSAWG